MDNDFSIIVLAAGKGVRMNANYPKVLTKLDSQTLIENLLENIKQAGYLNSVSIIVGFNGQEIIDLLGDKYNFIWQIEQLGTGHAVQQCQIILQGKFRNHLILCGDVPFISPQTIKSIIDVHQKNNSVLTMIALKLSDFEKENKTYWHFGRIIRDENNDIIKITEFKDANEQEKNITEVNPAIYCVQDEWLWENLNKIKNNNKQREYYLTGLVNLAHQQNIKINSFVINDGFELMGVNTKEDLKLAQKIYKEKQ